jgi:hypothetical protein
LSDRLAIALRPARRRASARRSSRLGTMLAEEISQAVRVVEENIETFACHQPGGSSSSPKLQPSLTSFRSSGPREKPTFLEIWALKSLRKGWENKTEPVAVTKRIPIAEIDARDARSRRAVEVSTVWRRQEPVAKHPSRLFVSIGLVDRRNYPLFQPLLYQRVTSKLTPSQLSSPVRTILQPQENTTVTMSKVIERRGRAGGRCQ